MSPPVVLSKQHARCSADLRLLAARSAIEAREEGTGVEGSSACRQSVAAVANMQSVSIVPGRRDREGLPAPTSTSRQKRSRAPVVALQVSRVEIREILLRIYHPRGWALRDSNISRLRAARRHALYVSKHTGPVPSAVVYK